MRVIHNRLYFWGWGLSVNGTPTNIGYYDGTNYVAVPFIGFSNNDIHDIIEYNDDLIAVGDFEGSLGVDLHVFNDSGIIGDLGVVTSITGYSGIRSALYHNGHLFVGGFVNDAGGVPVHRIAHYDGTNWDDMGVTSENSVPWVGAATITITTMHPFSDTQIIVS